MIFAVHLACTPADSSTPGGSGGKGSGGNVAGTGGASVASSGGSPGSGGLATGGEGTSSGGADATGGTTVTGSGGRASGGAAAGGSGTGGNPGPGSGGITGGGGGPGVGCAYKLCEDFESGAVGAYPTGWTLFKGYGAGAATDVGLSTEQFHSGKMALKSSSKATGQGRVQKALASLGATADKHWGRIFYRVKSPPIKPASGVLHVTWLGLYGNGENRVVDIVENNAGKHQWLYNNPDDRGSLGSDYNWMFDDAWHCAEWYIDVNTKSYRFFSDSKEVTQIGFMNKSDSEMSSYKQVIVGATFYQNPPDAFTIWFDDLAINDTQVGCN